MLFPSKAHEEWHLVASAQLREQSVPRNRVEKFNIDVWLYPPDLRKADSSNKFESLMDLLVDNGVIADDNWFATQKITIHPAEIDRENPRAEIIITPLP